MSLRCEHLWRVLSTPLTQQLAAHYALGTGFLPSTQTPLPQLRVRKNSWHESTAALRPELASEFVKSAISRTTGSEKRREGHFPVSAIKRFQGRKWALEYAFSFYTKDTKESWPKGGWFGFQNSFCTFISSSSSVPLLVFVPHCSSMGTRSSLRKHTVSSCVPSSVVKNMPPRSFWGNLLI